ncbi:MAG: hypothetical protein DI533_00035 [Cereibacter sphaeroides]|uniref:Uncharacterized protein n=1 Tax=Cereibacter sphaeroides TaxID=1063 RepID=A0A2W5SAY5_CERSP|nr:MAG: hypothetical protein DI533_00035 [Cereibacter sphaeroides]
MLKQSAMTRTASCDMGCAIAIALKLAGQPTHDHPDVLEPVELKGAADNPLIVQRVKTFVAFLARKAKAEPDLQTG